MDFHKIRVEMDKDEAIATITLDMPETRNALDLISRAEVLEAFLQIRDDDAVKAVILTGSGKAFCSGGDIRTMEGVSPVAARLRLKRGQRLVRTMLECDKPIIAAINGVTAGAGVSLMLASDLVLASEEARFIVSFVRLGLLPDWGLFYLLPLRVGVARAKEIMFFGDPIDAREAERIGLINRVVPAEKLQEEAFGLAKRLAKGPNQAHAMIKMALNRWPTSIESLLEMESTMQAVAFSSQDFEEGRKAFLEKRSPAFSGR